MSGPADVISDSTGLFVGAVLTSFAFGRWHGNSIAMKRLWILPADLGLGLLSIVFWRLSFFVPQLRNEAMRSMIAGAAFALICYYLGSIGGATGAAERRKRDESSILLDGKLEQSYQEYLKNAGIASTYNVDHEGQIALNVLRGRVFSRLYDELLVGGRSPQELVDSLRSFGASDATIEDVLTAFQDVALQRGNVV